MRKLLVMTLLVALLAAAQAAAQSPPVLTLVKAARLLDPRTGKVLTPAAVLIENEKISEVGSPSQLLAHAPAAVRTIDLGSATLLPGLIDSHTHLLLDVVVPPESEINRRGNGMFLPGLLLAIAMSPSARVLLGAQLAREDLESGSRRCAISVTPVSMVMSRCATRSMPVASPARGCWPPGVN